MAGMKQIQTARVVVLRLDEAEAEKAAQRLQSLGMPQVVGVSSIAELSVHIAGGKVDVIVLADSDLPDGLPCETSGQVRPPLEALSAGIPCLLLLSSLSRGATRAAMSAGFAAVLAADVAPRMIYRRVGALMQRVRRIGRARDATESLA
jgi:DNA-binding NarL/FixJ family response regulator